MTEFHLKWTIFKNSFFSEKYLMAASNRKLTFSILSWRHSRPWCQYREYSIRKYVQSKFWSAIHNIFFPWKIWCIRNTKGLQTRHSSTQSYVHRKLFFMLNCRCNKTNATIAHVRYNEYGTILHEAKIHMLISFLGSTE